MVPDDLVKPQHVSIAMSELTPAERPLDLTDEIWDLIDACADEDPDFDAVEILECLTEGRCSDKAGPDRERISLSMVLFFLAERADPDASSRSNLSGRR